ncbi:hypothetical protein [Haloarcula sp. CBA1122]|uniref:hypothetical protein n=1 Tax=Haloarcula sp. CBA1122 TaxID=2668069 RepID=UPI00130B61A9|nr:hypothetical protein [Haloarcula sp. CBA1122]MUV51342.1 hypothetical protein [Haloarcula sp. CBA1122]
MQQSNHRAHKSEPNTTSTARRTSGDDSPEDDVDAKTDSREDASHPERTQIGAGSSTLTDDPQSKNTVRACPECDTTAITARSGDKLRGRPSDDHYACRHCGATFDDPIERERQATPGDPGYIAGKLAKADPDDVSADHVGEPMTDGGKYECDACGDTFQTLTKLRIHEKDDCPQRETFTELNPDSDGVGLDAAEGLLTCRSCDQEFPNVRYDQRTSFADGNFHIIVEFECPGCGFDNENRIVATGVDRDNLDDLPEHLHPDDEEIATDGGITVEGKRPEDVIEQVTRSAEPALASDELNALERVADHLRDADHPAGASVDEQLTDTRIEAASKLRTLADDLERAARHSVADDVDVSVHVTVEETFRGSWGDD